MFCHSCGAQVPDDAAFCRRCGQAVAAPGAPVSPTPVPWRPPARAEAHTGRWIGAGWRVVQGDLGNYVLLTIVSTILAGAVPFILQGPMIAGVHIFTMKKLMGRRAEFGDLFTGFNFFLPTLVATILIGIFTFCGFLLFIIPGLIVAAMYKFTYLFIVDKKMDFWPAMQASHAVVRQDYFGFVMFLLALIGINILGFCCLLVGLLVSVPVTYVAITVAYSELVGFEPASANL